MNCRIGRNIENATGVQKGVPQSVTCGQFTTQQLKTLAESVKGLQDWPKITDDPKVNYAVEVEASRARGSFA